MQHQSSQTQSCIQECLKCYSTCLGMLTSHCLQAGGKHMEAEHVRIMMACAEICEDCAKSCEQVGDMDECVRQCRACAESCRRMAA